MCTNMEQLSTDVYKHDQFSPDVYTDVYEQGTS